MKTNPSDFVVPSGLSYPQAQTLAEQIDADEPSAEQLVSGFFPDFVSVELAKQIKSGKPDTDRLREMLLGAELVAAIAKAITARHANEATP